MSETLERTAERPETAELATNIDGRDITRGFVDGLDYLQPQDEVLRLRCRGDWRVYEELLRDDRVFAAFSQRKDAVLAHEFKVDPGGDSPLDKEAADFIRETVERLRFDDVTDKMLNGLFFGFAVAECLWSVSGSKVTLDDIKVRKQRRFRFAQDGTLKLLTAFRPDGETMPPRKFWTFCTGADNDDEPYGLGLAHWVYWPCWFKRNGLKSWQEFLRRLGTPTPVGKYPAGATEEERRKLLDAVAAIQEGSGITVPEGTLIELLEASKTAADYRSFYETMDTAITRIILKQTMTSDDGSSLSQSQTHLAVRDQTVKRDADLICQSFNAGPVTWLTEWNFPGAAIPRVWREMETPENLDAIAERDVRLFQCGFRRTPESVAEVYGEGFEAAPTPAPQTSPLGFAEPADAREPAESQSGFADRLTEEAAPLIDGMTDAVRRVLMEAKTLDEIPDRILELDLSADIGELAGLIQKAMAAAKLLGVAEVRQEVARDV